MFVFTFQPPYNLMHVAQHYFISILVIILIAIFFIYCQIFSILFLNFVKSKNEFTLKFYITVFHFKPYFKDEYLNYMY